MDMLETIKQHIDDLADLYLAEQRLLDSRAGHSKTHSLDDMERSLGLKGAPDIVSNAIS